MRRRLDIDAAAVLVAAVFVIVIGIREWVTAPALDAPWLERAGVLRGGAESGDTSLWRALSPVEDPRVAPAVALLSTGLPASAVAAVFRGLAIAIGAAVVAWLSRRRRGFAGLSAAVILACAPLWSEAARVGDPHLGLGFLFLLLSACAPDRFGRIRLAAEVALLGWALTWSPWAWVALLPLTIARAAAKDLAIRQAMVVAPLAVLFAGLINPPALIAPAQFLRAMVWQAGPAGLPGSFTPVGIEQHLWPFTSTLHAPGLLLFAVSAAAWPPRLRSGDAAPLACAGIVLLVLLANAPTVAPLLIVLPWAAGEAGRAAEAFLRRTRLSTSAIASVALIVTVIAPLVVVQTQRALRERARGDPAGDALGWIERNLPPSDLVAIEAGLRPDANSRRIWFTIPFHSLVPASQRGAYWTGWYREFGAIVVQESRVRRLLREPQESREILRFYAHLQESGGEEHVFGSIPGERVRVFARAADRREPFADGWRERVAGGEAGGLTAEFLAGLASALARAGDPGAAVDLLTEARVAGYEMEGIYINLASALLAMGRVNEAGRILDEGSLKHPNSPELLYNLGLALTRAELWDRAVETLARVRRLWPKSAPAAYLMGYALANRGNVEAARFQLAEALRLDPELPQRETAIDLLDRLEKAKP